MTLHTLKKQLLTIPNFLSFVRLALIPVFVSLYRSGELLAAAAVIVLSGLTDLLDGWYARRYNAITDVGKVLDPIADKLTQAAAIGMLIADHPLLLVPLLLLVVKEITACVSGMLVIRKTGTVPGAVWHGKATTALLYLLMFVHILWQDIPPMASNIMTAACIAMMLLSMTLYTVDRYRRIRGGRGGS